MDEISFKFARIFEPGIENLFWSSLLTEPAYCFEAAFRVGDDSLDIISYTKKPLHDVGYKWF